MDDWKTMDESNFHAALEMLGCMFVLAIMLQGIMLFLGTVVVVSALRLVGVL